MFVNEPPRDKTNKLTCAPQRRLRSAWATAQSDKCLRCALTGQLRTHAFFMRTAKTQTGRMPRLIGVFAGRTRHFVDFVMRRLKYWFSTVWSKISVSLFVNSIFHAFNFKNFQVFVCENWKLPFLGLKQLCRHLRKNLKWTALRHSQMINVSKHASGSNVFLPLFTPAWKLLPAYFFIFVVICQINLHNTHYIIICRIY